jgi:hypothetical protein
MLIDITHLLGALQLEQYPRAHEHDAEQAVRAVGGH